MKLLSLYIVEQYITESFQSSWLQKLGKAMKGTSKSYYDFSHRKQVTINRIVSARSIRWDKVTDEYAQVFNKDDEAGKKLIRKYIRNGSDGIVLLINTDGEVIGLGNLCTKAVIKFMTRYDNSRCVDSQNIKAQRDFIDIVTSYSKFVIFNFDSNNDPENVIINLDDKDSNYSRILAKDGMVFLGDADYYKQIAAENVRRYKNIIAKNKAARMEEQVSRSVKSCLDRVMRVSRLFENTGADMADKIWTYSFMMDTVDKLMKNFSSYIKNKVTAQNSSNNYRDMDIKSAEKNKTEIDNYLKKINNYLDKIEGK